MKVRKVVAACAVLAALPVPPASASASKSSTPSCDASVQWCLTSIVEETGGDFRAHANIYNNTPSIVLVDGVTAVLYQCSGTGGSCTVIAANSGSVAVAAYGNGALYTSYKVGSFGHTYKVCSSISGTTMINVCTPLMAYTTA